jgi:hypothetical protein
MNHFRVGDRVRLTSFPKQKPPGYFRDTSTDELFQDLVTRGAILRIYRIDEHRIPWVRTRRRRSDGLWQYHYVSVLPDENWELVSRSPN